MFILPTSVSLMTHPSTSTRGSLAGSLVSFRDAGLQNSCQQSDLGHLPQPARHHFPLATCTEPPSEDQRVILKGYEPPRDLWKGWESCTHETDCTRAAGWALVFLSFGWGGFGFSSELCHKLHSVSTYLE